MREALNGIVLDASVAINLVATGRLEEILRALAVPTLVTPQVEAEVFVDPRTRARTLDLLGAYVATGVLTRVELAGDTADLFLDLTGADFPDDLADGESSTLAIAWGRNIVAAIDETKARRVASQRFPGLVVLTTIDLLRRQEVRIALGEEELREAVFDALRLARMRIAESDDRWVRQLLGSERCAACPSLRRRKL